MKKYFNHPSVYWLIQKIRSHKEKYQIDAYGVKLIVYPEVMSPKYDHSSAFIIENLSIRRDDLVLEIGSGTGVISLFALLGGARFLVATDNPAAVENTKENLRRYGYLAKAKVYEGDLFDKLAQQSKFDKIIFNAPFHGTKPQDSGYLSRLPILAIF